MATRPRPGLTRGRARDSVRAEPARPAPYGASPEGATPARPHRSRGQSLAEFSLTVPMALLLILFGLDFGRVFLGWVALNNAAREAANYAAMNPTAWSIPYNLAVQSEFVRLVQTEASSINCVIEDPIPDPTFPSGTSIGAPASVALTCQFNLITPFIGILVGNPIPVSASSAFPVRSGLIESVPIETPTPAPTTSAAPVSTASSGPIGSSPPATAAPTSAPTATPVPTPDECTVISLIDVNTSKAQANWKTAGFSGAVIFSPLVPPNYRIAWQNLTAGTSVDCTSGITVRSRAP